MNSAPLEPTGRGGRTIAWLGPLLAAVLLLAVPSARAANRVSREYEIKAAFIHKFGSFVEWPAQALPDSTFVVGILGRSPFGSAMETISGKTVKGRTLSVRQVNSVQEALSCQILFVSPSEEGRLRSILDGLRSASVLTVGEGKDFTRNGGMIGFYLESDKVRFAINPQAAERARLTISAPLLRVATTVRG